MKNIIEDNPKKIWENCKRFSGLDETTFFDYFDGSERGFAIEIKDLKMFEPVEPNTILSNFHPPQSYCYIYTI